MNRTKTFNRADAIGIANRGEQSWSRWHGEMIPPWAPAMLSEQAGSGTKHPQPNQLLKSWKHYWQRHLPGLSSSFVAARFYAERCGFGDPQDGPRAGFWNSGCKRRSNCCRSGCNSMPIGCRCWVTPSRDKRHLLKEVSENHLRGR